MTLCECGSNIIDPVNMKRHLTSKKHFNLLYEEKEKKRLQENGLYKAKIYKIVNNVDDKIYVGSTIQPLYKRINQHRKRYYKPDMNQYSSCELFDAYGIENCNICLIEEIEVHNVEEQRKIEREWYDKLIDVSVNKRKPFVSTEENVELSKLYNAKIYHNKYNTIKERRKELGKYTCECGSCIDVVEKTRHHKSKKHQEYTQALYIKK
jgi:predicted GIY-YIG superfamily endonuclease